MVDVLEIKNFKSIRHLRLHCKRINILIGEPNTGKTNILECLGIMSYLGHARHREDARGFVRYATPGNLFYDGALDLVIEIATDGTTLAIQFENGRFHGTCRDEGGQTLATFTGDHTALGIASTPPYPGAVPFKYYRFAVHESPEQQRTDFLLPPTGQNLVSLLLSRRELRSLANDLVSPFGLRLGIRPQEGKIEVIKEYEDIIVSSPYTLMSETLQRVIFYLAAILPNKESVLIFEEPEAHAFPYYTKYLAELISLDENRNQYFISTHNPYFLLPILEKTPKDEIAVFITYFEDYETKVKPLSEEDLVRLTEMDVFSNLDIFLGEQ